MHCLLLLIILLLGSCYSANASATRSWPSHVAPLSEWQAVRDMLRTKDENSVVLIYDSADVNSLRAIPNFTDSSASLAGIAAFYAIDIRTRSLSWLLDSLNVQIVPAIRGFSWAAVTRASWDNTPLARVGILRRPVEWPADQSITASTLKTFALSLQAGANALIERVETDAKARALRDKLQRGGRPSLVAFLPADRRTSLSPIHKALAIRYNERAYIIEVLVDKAPSVKSLFRIDTLPSYAAYDANGTQHNFRPREPTIPTTQEIDEFFSPFAPKRAITATLSDKILERAVIRQTNVLVPITSHDEWRDEVLDSPSITAVLFLDNNSMASERSSVIAAFIELASKWRTASPVSRFVWLDRRQNPKLYAQLCRINDEEPAAELVFLSTKRKVFQRYPTTVQSAQALSDFVHGPLTRGVAAVQFKELASFGQ